MVKRPVADIGKNLSAEVEEASSSSNNGDNNGGIPAIQLRSYQLEGVKWLIWNWWNLCSFILADDMGLGSVSILHFCYFYHKLDYYNVSLNPWLVLFRTSCIVPLFVFKLKENDPIHGFPGPAFLSRGIANLWAFPYLLPIIPCKIVLFRSSNMGYWYGCHSLPWLHRF